MDTPPGISPRKDPHGIAVLTLAAQLFALSLAAAGEPMLPKTTAPIVYTIDYSGAFFLKPEYIEQFKPAPPDLLHMGKAVPISHLWGPIRLYQGENQETGGPGHTLSWENIALLSPEALSARIETIRETLRRYHAVGIPEIVPYISYHALAGDHQTRKGFWEFYDKWDTYAQWAGPKPPHDPFDWLAVDAKGTFIPGSCGGYSPDYFAPLHRYRACINHPDWAEWQRRLMRMIAEAGYDGCFVDNAHPDPCFCRHCKALFRRFLTSIAAPALVKRLGQGLDLDRLTLDAADAPAELVRRWRVLRTGEHLGMLREEGRKVKPGFTVFPNSGNIQECLQVGGLCDRLMFESTFSPGVMATDEPPETEEIAITVSNEPVQAKTITHRYELNDGAAWMEMQAEILLPAKIQTGKAARFEIRVNSVGSSLADEDAAEDFHLVLQEAGGEPAKLDLEPKGALGGTGSSRKPKQPPATLSAIWTPAKAGRYAVSFGFRYTDDSHKDTNLRLRLDKLSWGTVCRTHMPNLLFARHMRAKPIYLGYEAARKGWENVQELSHAEMAAFSGGGGFAGRGAPQAKYRGFLKKHASLFEGWEPAAPTAVLYSLWGPNPLNAYRPYPTLTLAQALGQAHSLFVSLVDKTLPESAEELRASFHAVCLVSPSYELSAAQLAALDGFAQAGGQVEIAGDKVLINGEPAAERFARWRRPGLPVVPGTPVAPEGGLRSNLRFALYRQGDRLALHIVNYNVCLLDPGKRVLEVEPTELTLALPADWRAAQAACYDPDAEPQALACTVAGNTARLTIPKTHLYKIVVLDKK